MAHHQLGAVLVAACLIAAACGGDAEPQVGGARAPGQIRTITADQRDPKLCRELGQRDRAQDEKAGVLAKEIQINLPADEDSVPCWRAYADGYNRR